MSIIQLALLKKPNIDQQAGYTYKPLILQMPRNILLCHEISVVPKHKQAFQMKEQASDSKVCYPEDQPALFLLSEQKWSSQCLRPDDWALHPPLVLSPASHCQQTPISNHGKFQQTQDYHPQWTVLFLQMSLKIGVTQPDSNKFDVNSDMWLVKQKLTISIFLAFNCWVSWKWNQSCFLFCFL